MFLSLSPPPIFVPASSQPKLYKSVIEDVISEVRELFLDEGVDEQVLLELKTVTVSSIIVPVYNRNAGGGNGTCADLCRSVVRCASSLKSL